MNDSVSSNETLHSALETLHTRVTTLEHEAAIHADVEDSLRLELTMTQQYLELAGVILIALNTQGEIALINAKGCDVLGWKKDTLLGQDWFDTCLPPDERTQVRHVFQQLVAGTIAPVEFFENSVLTQSGQQRLIAWHNALLTDEVGQIIGILSSGEDITEHRRSQEALRESTERYRNLFNRVPVGLYKTTPEGQIVDANPALVAMLGYPDRATLLARKVQDLFVHPETRQAEQERVAQEGVVHRFQMRLRCYDGTIIWVEDNVRSIRDSEDREYYEGSLTDITDRKDAELALLESEARFRSVSQTATDAIITADSQGYIVFWNEAAETMFGYKADDIVGQPLTQIMPERYRQRHLEGMSRFLATGNSGMIGKRMERVGQRRDGTEFSLEFTLAAWEAGENVFFSAILRDITDRKQAEETLRKLSRAVEQSPSSVMITDTQGVIEYVNPKFTQLTGYSLDEVIGQNPSILKSGETLPEEYQRLWTTISSGEEWQGEFHNRKKNGELFWESMSISPIKDAQGHTTHYLAVGEDITQRKQIEEAEREQRALAEALRETAATLNSTLDVNVVLDNILINLERVVPHDTASVMIIESPDMARVVRSHGYHQFGIPDNPTKSPLRLRIDELTGLRRMVESKQPVLIANTQTDPAWVHREEDPFALRSYVAAPIIWNGNVIGFLNLRSVTIGFFTREHTPRLQAFADQVATALHNAQMFAAERDQRLLAETLAEAASVLTSTLALDTVLDHILESVGRVVPHDAANIMLLDGTTIRVAANRGYQQEKPSEIFLREHRFSLDAPHLREMLETGRPVLIPDTARFSGWEQRPNTAWIRSYAAAPILAYGQVIGFLNLDDRTPGFFTQEHIYRLQAFANQASIAIEHAQLYEEMSRYAADLERRVAERTTELQKSEARYRATIEDQTDMIDRYLPGGVLTFVNRAYCEYFQRQPEELLGTSFWDQMPDDERARLEQHIASLSRENPVATIEVRKTAPDGTARWFHWIDRMIFDEQGNFVEYQGVGRDITARKRAEEKLHQMLAREIELSELKSRYVSMAAHDLRNPLAIIHSTLSLIQHYGDRMTAEKKQTKYNHIEASIQVMVDMLDDILTIGQAESGKLTFKPESMDVVGFCQRMMEEMSQAAAVDGRIDFSSQGDSCNAHADSRLLRHILGNLLSNAIKYSPDDNPVTFTVNCGPDQITFRVQDHGIGIPEGDQQHLFEAFHRAGNVGQVSGTGLGLAIVKQSVELHGGTISFESQQGIGTTFTVSIPHISSAE